MQCNPLHSDQENSQGDNQVFRAIIANKSTANISGLQILHLEDHFDTRCVVATYLRDCGHHVTEASNVAEAIEKLHGATFDLFLSDICLPDGTGWDVMEIAPPPPSTLAVAMTALLDGKSVGKSLSVGFHHHLPKPLSPDVLDRVVDEARAMANRHLS